MICRDSSHYVGPIRHLLICGSEATYFSLKIPIKLLTYVSKNHKVKTKQENKDNQINSINKKWLIMLV